MLNEKERRALWLSLALNAVIVLLGLIGAVMSFISASPTAAALRFYTLDSNLFLLTACAVQAYFEAGILLGKGHFVPSWVRLFKYFAVCTTTVTFFIVLLVLMPMMGGLSAFVRAFLTHSSLFHHFLCPVLGFASFVFRDHPSIPDRRVTIAAVVPTLVYGVVAVALNIARVLYGPYPFLCVYEQPVWASVVWIIGILLFAWMLAWVIWKLALCLSDPEAAEPGLPPEPEAWTEDGYLKDQDALSSYTYRSIPACHNSCGPVAAFNLRHYAGHDARFPEVLEEMDRMHLFRIPGPTHTRVMRRYCSKYLPELKEVEGREEAVAAAAASKMGVLRYHEEMVPHFVAYCRSDGGFRFFNVNDGGEDITLTMAEFAEGHLRGGSVRLMYWN